MNPEHRSSGTEAGGELQAVNFFLASFTELGIFA
jgi:hypothetical protein